MSLWDQVSAESVLGLNTAQVPPSAQVSTMPGVARASGPTTKNQPPPWSPDSPLFWFAALAGVTFGFVAVSTSVRVGPGKVSASIGK